jgi:hypothetical protein
VSDVKELQMEQWSGARAGTPARAVVSAGGVDTEYVRAGRGEPVVLLAADIESLEVQRTIDVAARNCLIIAASPPSHTDFTAWLRGFLDGLGLTHARVVMDAGELLNLVSTGEPNDV